MLDERIMKKVEDKVVEQYFGDKNDSRGEYYRSIARNVMKWYFQEEKSLKKHGACIDTNVTKEGYYKILDVDPKTKKIRIDRKKIKKYTDFKKKFTKKKN